MSTRKTRAEDLAAALRRRFRTGPSRSSMGLSSLGQEAAPLDPPADGKLNESDDPMGDEIPDYDPASPEPRYLQLAKAELKRRKDLRCRDCGFMGLPPPDGLCPECGGQLETPQAAPDTNEMTTAQIRQAIRAQWAQKQGVVKE